MLCQLDSYKIFSEVVLFTHAFLETLTAFRNRTPLDILLPGYVQYIIVGLVRGYRSFMTHRCHVIVVIKVHRKSESERKLINQKAKNQKKIL